jgi:hypothetical protein
MIVETPDARHSTGCVMKIHKHHVVFSMPIVLLIQLGTARQQIPADSSSLVSSPRPLADAARRLQETYGKVVTYEEPILTWRGELQAKPGRNPEAKWELFPMPQSFLIPKSGLGTDLANALENTIAAYHQQTSGTHFQILSSRLGYHIVPIQKHDENGQSVPAISALDQIVTIPSEARSAEKHLLALGAAISSTGPIRVVISAVPGSVRGFDTAFRARPEVFPWGAYSAVARDALVDLLNQSATTFSWSLMCQASAQASDRFCALNLGAIEVAVTDSVGKPITDSQGNPEKKVLWYDRCKDCPPPEDPPNR